MVAETYCAIDGKKQALAALLIAEHIAAKIKDNFEENGLFASREEYRGKVAEAYLHCGYPAEAARVFDSMTDAYLINQIIAGVSSSLESAGRSSEADAIRALTRREPVAATHPGFAWNPLAEDSARGWRADSLLLITAKQSVNGSNLAKSPAACSLDVMIDSWYGKTLDIPVLIRLAQHYADLDDSARAKRVIIHIFAQYHAILGGSDDDTLLTKIVSICEHMGSECGAFALIPDTDYVACEVELLALAEIYCKQGDWQKCIRYASDLTSRDKKLIVFAALAGWYYILQPDTGDKQTVFLRKLVELSEK
jgi:hypothetical protein